MSAHKLQIELGRYIKVLSGKNKLCINCLSGDAEDDNHLLLTYAKYKVEHCNLTNAINLQCPSFAYLQNPERFIWMLGINEDIEILYIHLI